MTKKEIDVIIDILDFLDGNGIVFEDEGIVRKELKQVEFTKIRIIQT